MHCITAGTAGTGKVQDSNCSDSHIVGARLVRSHGTLMKRLKPFVVVAAPCTLCSSCSLYFVQWLLPVPCAVVAPCTLCSGCSLYLVQWLLPVPCAVVAPCTLCSGCSLYLVQWLLPIPCAIVAPCTLCSSCYLYLVQCCNCNEIHM